MAFDSFLQLGGIEIVNSLRAWAYATGAGCSFSSLRAPDCETLPEAEALLSGREIIEGADGYSYAEIEQAPWYDGSEPDLSRRFFGVYGLRIEQIEDSTRAVEVSDGIPDGGYLGPERRNSREFRVTALLLAQGQDALSFGMRWLDTALGRTICGRHGGACGTTDLAFFTGCPIGRVSDPSIGPWEFTARNLVPNPAPMPAPAPLEGWSLAREVSGAGTQIVAFRGITRFPRPVDALRPYVAEYQMGGNVTVPGDPTQVVEFGSTAAGAVELEADTPYLVLMDVKRSASGTGRAYATMRVETAAGEVWEGERTLLDSFQETSSLRVRIPADRVGTSAQVYVRVDREESSTSGEPGVRIYLSRQMILKESEFAANVPDYFDGDSAAQLNPGGDAIARYSWEGARNASPSVLETREIVLPQTDEEYMESLHETLRYLHDAATVSGPFETERRKNSDGSWVMEVEFTIVSERPYIYGAPTRVENSGFLQTQITSATVENLMREPRAATQGPLSVTMGSQVVWDPFLGNTDAYWTFQPGTAQLADGIGYNDSTYMIPMERTSTAVLASARYEGPTESLAAGNAVTMSGWVWLRLTGTDTVLTGAVTLQWRNASGGIISNVPFSLPADELVKGIHFVHSNIPMPAGATTFRIQAAVGIQGTEPTGYAEVFFSSFGLTRA